VASSTRHWYGDVLAQQSFRFNESDDASYHPGMPLSSRLGWTLALAGIAMVGAFALAEGGCGGGSKGAGVGGNGGIGGAAGSPGAGCPGPAPQGCCLKDDDCPIGNEGVQICVTTACQASSVAGVCKPQIPSDSTQCWSDADCYGTERCVGAQVCPCGAACLLADQIGHCLK
jgi:hypothetical protein